MEPVSRHAWKGIRRGGFLLVAVALVSCGGQKGEGGKDVLHVGLGGWMLSQFPAIVTASEAFSQRRETTVKFYKYGAAPPPYIMEFRYGRCGEDVILAGRFDRMAAAKLGALVDLEKTLPPDTFGRLIDPAAAEAMRTGKFTDLPFLGEVMVLNYNRTLLAKAGIAEPARNWEELEDHAARLRQASPRLVPVAVVLNSDSQVYFYFPSLLGRLGTCEDKKGFPLTEGPAAKEALQRLARWRQAGYCNGVDADAFSLFRSGDAAYFISWASHGAMARASFKEGEIGFVPLAGPAFISFHRGVIPKTTRFPELSGQFLSEVVLGPELQSAIYASGKVGVLKEDFASGRVPAWVMPLREQVEHGSIGPTAPMNLESLDHAIHKALQGIAAGLISPDQAMADMTAARRVLEKQLPPSP